MSPRPEPFVIGVAERIDIPSWHVRGLAAKVDTGARTSALHVENLREIGSDHVRFDIPLVPGRRERHVTVDARIIRHARVRSTNGESRPRIFVSVQIKLGPLERQIELGLVDRTQMQFRMLIGRSAIARACLVDVSKTYLLTRKPKSKRRAAKARGKRSP
ncbi:MAG TPA: RimK/LysX family protein [Polyangiaceae bacterium]|nr:RimK/LysX family protein [Polyangiaceae bacterium]